MNTKLWIFEIWNYRSCNFLKFLFSFDLFLWMTFILTYLEPKDFILQLSLEIQELLDCQFVIEIGSEVVGGQSRTHGFQGVPCCGMVTMTHANTGLRPYYIPYLNKTSFFTQIPVKGHCLILNNTYCLSFILIIRHRKSSFKKMLT